MPDIVAEGPARSCYSVAGRRKHCGQDNAFHLRSAPYARELASFSREFTP